MDKLSGMFDFKEDSFVGYITQFTYDKAVILSHDWYAGKVNFIPQGSFLIVKAELPDGTVSDYFLLRVLNISYVDSDTKRNKEVTIQKNSNYDNQLEILQKELNDPINQNKLSFYELNCSLLGTYSDNTDGVNFGTDAYSFNVSMIYKVYKPKAKDLEKIVNFVKKDRLKATHELLSSLSVNKAKVPSFPVGKVRYASTRKETSDELANVEIFPSDFIKQKTGVFGMTRTGKSNTVKIIVKSIMDLSASTGIKMGQLIYDINGEYANDNEQNKRLTDKNLYTVDVEGVSNSKFKPSLNNFYLNPNYGLEIIKAGISSEEKGSNYLNVFLSIKDVASEPLLYILWIALLYKSGFAFPDIDFPPSNNITKETSRHIISGNMSFFNILKKEIVLRITNEYYNIFPSVFNWFEVEIKNNEPEYKYIRINETKLNEVLHKYFKPKFEKVNDKLILERHPLYGTITEESFDNELHYFSLLGFILQEDRTGGGRTNTSGWHMIVKYQYSHCKYAIKDYRVQIFEALKSGETVIIDFSIGDEFTRKYIADELMKYIFEEDIKIFRTGDDPCPIITVFIEEAHNVIGKGASVDTLWPRIAKEGAKYNIGIIYATQEPSAIHESILANTANFIVAHLNNETEINTICKYEDMGDFRQSILRSEDVGFVRMRLLSKPYTIPVQINKFE